ncbi:protein of unknown function [Paraburkholderia dioscoreae]|uniref:Uncharacterized protein n=1 Tax=Paraburkholderia dioscoreae TaxID=2604047 RepID=A0A5Q4YY78_9BURK|nr:protein of unknown function [Paraburkholderia dioscoreae]
MRTGWPPNAGAAAALAPSRAALLRNWRLFIGVVSGELKGRRVPGRSSRSPLSGNWR